MNCTEVRTTMGKIQEIHVSQDYCCLVTVTRFSKNHTSSQIPFQYLQGSHSYIN